MKFIQKLCFSGEAEEALEKYKKAFGCTIRNLLHYSDAVINGWERPDEEKESLVYHSEIMFGDQEVRMNDLSDEAEVELTRKVIHIIGFDTAEEVENAFSVLSDGGRGNKATRKTTVHGNNWYCKGSFWSYMGADV
ncbi:hypothetical protein [Lacrimispora xylanisolvens]|uniref:hypothetical protein n=1 Tax=Lacrimispora xylanisolvens TaxID=384636 RepID=UPI002402C349